MAIKKKLLLLFAGLLFVTPFYAAHAVQDIFLEVPDLNFKRIPILSYTLGVERSTQMKLGTRVSSGVANVAALSLSKLLDGASTRLFEYAITGKMLREVKLELFNPQTKQIIMTITLQNVVISSLATSNSRQDNRPTETLALSYGKITQEHYLYKPDGSKAGVARMAFNVELGQLE